MYIIGMILGPLLDGLHVHSGVLAYNEPEKFQAWWVPFLFGAATLSISVLVILVEKFFKQNTFTATWKSMFITLVVFILSYAFSAYSSAPSWAIFLAIAIVARRMGVYFIKNKAGLVMACIVTIIGPLVEITLTSLGLFHYIRPDVLGIPMWLLPLYFCAAITVGVMMKMIFQLKVWGSRP